MSFGQKMLTAAKVLALTSLTALIVETGLLARQANQTLSSFQTTIQPLAQKAALDLDEAHRLELEAALTAMEARKASAEERKALPVLTAQVQRSLRDMDALLVAARQTTDGVGVIQQQIAQSTVQTMATLNTTVQNVQPVLAEAQHTIAGLGTVAADVDKQVSDPAVTEILHHLDGTTASVEATTKDLQQEVHSITHPGWAHRMWEWSLDIAHVFNPL
jgi:hypothetical protein